MPDDLLLKTAKFIEEVNTHNSKKFKEEVINKYKADEDLRILFKFMFSPFITLGVTAACLKTDVAAASEVMSLESLLKALSCRQLTGHKAAAQCKKLAEDNSDYLDTLEKILNKDLKIGVSSKTMHNIVPDLVPLFEVALATDIKKVKDKDSFLASRDYLLMRKLDGIRCITFLDTTNNKVAHFSRTGQKFTSLSKLSEALLEAFPKGLKVFLDGEICIMKEGKEDFKAASGGIRRLEDQMEYPKYIIFDYLTPTEFLTGSSTTKYSERLIELEKNITPNENCSVIRTVKYSEENLEQLWKDVLAQEWEGLIARADVSYKSGRSKDLLKIKVFEDAEYKITRLEPKLQGVLIDDKMVPTEMVGALVFEHKGEEVKCGTGFSQEEAIYWWTHKDQVIGKVCTIQYQGESTDKDGKVSLRIPSFKGWRCANPPEVTNV